MVYLAVVWMVGNLAVFGIAGQDGIVLGCMVASSSVVVEPSCEVEVEHVVAVGPVVVAVVLQQPLPPSLVSFVAAFVSSLALVFPLLLLLHSTLVLSLHTLVSSHLFALSILHQQVY